MKNIRLVKFDFKPGGKEVWLDWSHELVRRTEEVQATLEQEGVIVEATFLSEDENSVYYVVADEGKGVSGNYPIDIEHREKRALSFGTRYELRSLFSFFR